MSKYDEDLVVSDDYMYITFNALAELQFDFEDNHAVKTAVTSYKNRMRRACSTEVFRAVCIFGLEDPKAALSSTLHNEEVSNSLQDLVSPYELNHAILGVIMNYVQHRDDNSIVSLGILSNRINTYFKDNNITFSVTRSIYSGDGCKYEICKDGVVLAVGNIYVDPVLNAMISIAMDLLTTNNLSNILDKCSAELNCRPTLEPEDYVQIAKVVKHYMTTTPIDEEDFVSYTLFNTPSASMNTIVKYLREGIFRCCGQKDNKDAYMMHLTAAVVHLKRLHRLAKDMKNRTDITKKMKKCFNRHMNSFISQVNNAYHEDVIRVLLKIKAMI